MKRLIVGLGTGRCGTRSLSFFLNNQPDVRVLHEGMLDGQQNIFAWQGDDDRILAWLRHLHAADQRFVGDIGMYFLPYVELLLENFPDSRFICMQREREQVVHSFLKHVPEKHHWFDHDGSHWQPSMWDASFPSFDTPDKRACIGRYWDLYAAEIERLARRHPRQLRCFATESLNSQQGKAAILDFLGYQGRRRLAGSYHKNQSQNPLRWMRPLQELKNRVLSQAIGLGRRTLPKAWRRWLWVHVGYYLY